MSTIASLADMQHAIRHEGVTSFKMFMAYPGTVMVDDARHLPGHAHGRPARRMICLHAENGTVIELLIREALAQGHTAPKYHALTRPALMEGEATHRGIKLAELAEAPVYFVHLSAKEALGEVVAGARRRHSCLRAKPARTTCSSTIRSTRARRSRSRNT